jgi:hypothetical protein
MKRSLRNLALYLGLVLGFSSPAMAISSADLHAVIYDTNFYDPNAADCSIDTSINLSGSDNAEKSFKFFLSKGLPAFQVAGIVGNFEAESSINPTRNQNGGGPGRGIAQWSVDGRWATLLKFAASRHLDPLDLGTQLQFAWAELAEDYNGSLTALKATANVADATTVFMVKYEQPSSDPSVNHIAKRIQFAQTYLAKYGGAAADGGTAVPAVNGSCSGSTGPGQDTKFVDGFAVYSQYDPTWRDKPYGSSTIGVSGCGPSAMAMIITALTGSQVTPDIVAAWAGSHGLYIAGAGSSWSIGPDVAKQWNLKSSLIGANIARITATLQAGGLVITAGEGPKPFTSAGHFIVIRGVTADGKWKVGDSAHTDTSSQDWDPQQLLVNMHDGSVYAITK